MSHVHPCTAPASSLLNACAQAGAYTDCYATDVGAAVSHAAFVEAFYTTGLFKLERFILAVLARKPASDATARQLALGELDNFSAWRVEARTADQLLLADFTGRTKSWLMVAPVMAAGQGVEPAEGPVARTTLYFGSAVVPLRGAPHGKPRMGMGFHALLGFHRLYSRLLLGAARAKVLRATPPTR